MAFPFGTFSLAGACCNQDCFLKAEGHPSKDTVCAGLQAGQAKSFSNIADALPNQSRAENVFCHQESGARLEVRKVEQTWCFAEFSFSVPETSQLQGFPEKSMLSLKETKIDTRCFAFVWASLPFLAESKPPPLAGQMLC